MRSGASTLSRGERVPAQRAGEGVRRCRRGLLTAIPADAPARTASLDCPKPSPGCSAATLSLRERVDGAGGSIQSKDWRPHWLSAAGIQRAPDLLNDPGKPASHVVVGETDFQIAGSFNLGSRRRVGVGQLGMLPAIHLDGEPRGFAGEIRYASGNRDLTTKLPAIEAPVAQLVPEHLFGRRFRRAKSPGNRDAGSWHRLNSGTQARISLEQSPVTSPRSSAQASTLSRGATGFTHF